MSQATRVDGRVCKYTDVATLEALIGQKDQEVTGVRSEYYRLVEQFKTQVKEKQAVCEQLNHQNNAKNRQLLQLRTKIQEFERKTGKSQNEMIGQMEANIKGLQEDASSKLKDGKTKVNELEEDLDSMDKLQKKKVIYEFKLMEWNTACRQKQDIITQAKYNNEIELAKMKREIEAEYDESLEKFKAQASQDAQRNIQVIEKNIHLENQKWTEKTISQRYEIDYHKRAINQQKEINKNLKRDLNIQQGTEEQYAERAEMQAKKINTYKQKIQVLEKSLAQIVADFEKEKELVRYQHEAIIKEQREDIINARENLRVKNKELRNVRALAQVVLDQRAEVEQFFLEALEQIKDEIRKKNQLEKKQKRYNGGVSQVGTGSQSQEDGKAAGMAGGSADGSQKPFSDKVDLNDLEWEDRERVLRLLFSKMNAGIPTNTQQARQNLKQVQNRENQMKALSDEGMRQIEAQTLAEQQLREQIQQQYGEEAFGTYVERQSEMDDQEEQPEELQAIEAAPAE